MALAVPASLARVGLTRTVPAKNRRQLEPAATSTTELPIVMTIDPVLASMGVLAAVNGAVWLCAVVAF